MTPKRKSDTPERTVDEMLLEFDAELRKDFENDPKYTARDINYLLTNMLYEKLFGSKTNSGDFIFSINVSEYAQNAVEIVARATTNHPLAKLGMYNTKITCKHPIAVFQRKMHNGKMYICGLNFKEMEDYNKGSVWETWFATMTPAEVCKEMERLCWLQLEDVVIGQMRKFDMLVKDISEIQLQAIINLYMSLNPRVGMTYSYFTNTEEILKTEWRKKLLDAYDKHIAELKSTSAEL